MHERGHEYASTVLAAVCACGAGPALAGVLLVDNVQVLQSWQQNTGVAARLVAGADGGSSLQWQGGLSLDAYRNDSSGGNLTTPLRDGTFYKVQAQGDLRATDAAGAVSYLQFSASHTDDRGVISHAPGGQINTLQLGRAGQGYLLALGDVVANFSALGANAGLRGLLGQRQVGRAVLSATAGMLTESWEALAGAVEHTRHPRQVLAAKLEAPWGQSGRLYATVQGYEDLERDLADGATVLAPASARSATAGFAYQAGRFSVQGEAGASRWQEEGRDGKTDHALVVDAGWSFERAGLRAGYHDIGPYYATLAAQGGNGVREAYLNGYWSAADWLNLNADLRHAENELAATPPPTTPPTPLGANAVETDALAVSAAITFGPRHPGWSLLLSQALSNGENAGGGSNRNRSHGATVSYAAEGWQGSLGYSRIRVENDDAGAVDGRTGAWLFNVGRTWRAEAWSLGLSLAASQQDQELDAGNGPRTTTWQFGLSGQRLGWGTLAASYLRGNTRQAGGDDLSQRGWQIEASHPFKGGSAVKLYLRDNEVSGSTATPSADYSERTAGLQLLYLL